MLGSVRPIETTYKGYRFRSRLEARWAVFFDALGIEWEYEKEGFVIESVWGEPEGYKNWYYLPDFYLPETETWVEVKGSFQDITDDYWYMLASAMDWSCYLPGVYNSHNTLRGLLCLFETPDINGSQPYPILQHHKGGFCETIKFSKNGIENCYVGMCDRFDSSWGMESGQIIKNFCKNVMEKRLNNKDISASFAAGKARSARFEHKHFCDYGVGC